MSTTQGPPSQLPRFEPKPGHDYIKLRPAHDFLKSTEKDLLAKADECLSRAGSPLDQPPTEVDPTTHAPKYDDFSQLRLFLEAQSCLAEVLRRRADQAAQRDRDRENRHFWIEIGLTILIVALIGVELYFSIHYGRLGLSEGRQQATILQQMNKNTADTAAQIQRAADAMTATLQVLQADRADRLAQAAKKPRLELFVSHVPLLKRHATFTPTQETDSSVTYHLDLWNRGDMTANRLYLRALVSSKDVTAYSNPGFAPEPDPTDASVQSFILAQVFLRSHSYFPVDITFIYQKGHAPFQVTFKTDFEESRTPTLLGVLPVNPRTPSK